MSTYRKRLRYVLRRDFSKEVYGVRALADLRGLIEALLALLWGVCAAAGALLCLIGRPLFWFLRALVLPLRHPEKLDVMEDSEVQEPAPKEEEEHPHAVG